ncbi:hypothetical protein DWF00_04705 [Bosea caraganae]|uniref:Uncharacterized protein n=1 Tax=Bosea caraganae TaxID=2763117 RepID=A0A370KZP2_9HYPH|nr:hypothetical protein [Bosea caraganae]RDJ20468.1 hypothetical protein DWE98_24415 [Bosea caraganae]RDJ29983.1 hypothetical protein DWF00_04705 [Bosea caraganae]
MRRLLAFLAAPLLAAFVATWFVVKNRPDYKEFVIFFAFCLAFYFLQLIIGLPVYKLLARWQRLSVGYFVGSGFVATAIVILLVLPSLGLPSFGLASGSTLVASALAGLLGASVGLVFWAVARPGTARAIANAD